MFEEIIVYLIEMWEKIDKFFGDILFWRYVDGILSNTKKKLSRRVN
jgi:hypothetical protein